MLPFSAYKIMWLSGSVQKIDTIIENKIIGKANNHKLLNSNKVW
jgi:hypothetical protein